MAEAAKGRGARTNATGRYEANAVEAFLTGGVEALSGLRNQWYQK